MSQSNERREFLVKLLRDSIADYTDGRADLARLVSDVESLIDSLQAVADRRWVERLRTAWGKLEIVYALMLDEGRSELTADDRSDVQNGIGDINVLLDQIPRTEQGPNPNPDVFRPT